MNTLEGEILNYDYIFCPLCDYRTGVQKYTDAAYAVKAAQAALASHLCRKGHQMARRDARILALDQPVVKAGTLIPSASSRSAPPDHKEE